MKKLGFGLMRLPLLDVNDSGSIDIEKAKEMVDAFLAKGFTYFDTAYMYCGGQSENAVKELLTKRHPRSSYTLATKLPPHMVKCKDDRDRLFAEQLDKTGAEYFDYYLLHCIDGETIKIFEEFDCFAWLRLKRESGAVRQIGFSFHGDAPLLDRILREQRGLDFVQLQINYLDWESDRVQSRACYEVARKYNVPIIVMEPVKGGALAEPSEEVKALFCAQNEKMSPSSWAIRFVAGLPGVMVVLSGMSNMQQLQDNISYMADFKPLEKNEIQLVHAAADMIQGKIAVPCTGCAYCVDGCPQNIAIPSCFSLYNQKRQKPDGEIGRAQYTALLSSYGAASACVGCGACEDACPQHLPIREYLRKVAECFEF